MKEQIINFNTAKLAKAKGFDIPVFSYYIKERPELIFTAFEDILAYCDIEKSSTNIIEYNYNSRDGISAPTQSLLQKWLREKHNIEAIVLPDFTNSKIRIYHAYTLISQFQPHILLDDNNKYKVYTNYEDALEEVLIIGLNLIEDDNK